MRQVIMCEREQQTVHEKKKTGGMCCRKTYHDGDGDAREMAGLLFDLFCDFLEVEEGSTTTEMGRQGKGGYVREKI